MRMIWEKDLLDLGSAALRCGNWIVLHSNPKTKQDKYLHNYYQGKAYAYLYALSKVRLVEFIDPKPIQDLDDYLETWRKGEIVCKFFKDPVILMDKKFFNKVLESPQPHQGKEVRKQIRKVCIEIK